MFVYPYTYAALFLVWSGFSSFVDETQSQSNLVSGLDFGFDADAQRSVSGSSTTAVVGLVSSPTAAKKDLDGDPETGDHSFIDDQASHLS